MIQLSRLTGWSKAEVEDLPWGEFLHCLDEALQLAQEEAQAAQAAMGGFR